MKSENDKPLFNNEVIMKNNVFHTIDVVPESEADAKGYVKIARIIYKDKEEEPKYRKNRHVVCIVHHNEPLFQGCTEFILKGDDKLQPLMCDQYGSYPNRVCLAGTSLCGKSYLAGKMAEDYSSRFPDNKICIFSYIDQDDAYDSLKNLHRIRIDESILDEPIDLKELHDALIIFDDIECFTNKYIRDELVRLRNACINSGRHEGIATISIRQQMLEGSQTKATLNGMFQFVGFPHAASRFQFGNWLDRYLGLNRKQIKEILKLPSRFVLVNNTAPLFVLYEKGCKLIEHDI